MDKEISLLEALTQVDFTIMHLDGKIVRIQGKKGQCIKPGSTMTCEGLGMPFHKTPYKFGNLFINFKIKFPEKIDPSGIEQVKQLLSDQATPSSGVESVTEICHLEKFEEHHQNTHAQGGTREDHMEEEDDDDNNPDMIDLDNNYVNAEAARNAEQNASIGAGRDEETEEGSSDESAQELWERAF